MSATPESTLPDPQQTIANLRRELGGCRDELDQALRNLNEMTTERDEALAREAATSEVLQVINSSPGDLTPVFDGILEKAHTLCGAAHGSLTLAEGEHFRAVATRGMPEEFAKVLRESFHAGSFGDRLSSGEPFVQIVDITAAEFAGEFSTENRVHRAAVGPGGVRTLLAVPLRKKGVLLGYITANRREVRPFTEKQIALLQNFAAQAVIAMENARLITETREALEQQTATAEVLSVINSSPGDLTPVFQAMLEKALRLCGATFGVMNRYDGEYFHHAADQGVPAVYAQYRRERGPTIYGLGTTPARLVAGESLIHVADLMATEAYERGEPARRALVDLGGARTHLTAALRKGNVLLGDISIYRQEVRPFSEKQTALLQNFAAQAVIAMENARLITETREALEQQTATAEVLRVINSSPGDLAPVFDAMLEKAIRLCEATHGHMFTYDGELFHLAAISGPPGYVEWSSQLGPVRSGPSAPLGRISRGERIVHVTDVQEEDVYHTSPGFREQADRRGVRSQITIALLKDDVLLGAMVVYRQEVRPFTDKQIALLQNLAAQAVIAMENARLLTETREALEQQTATAEVLQVINSSPGDLAPVFDAILEKAHALCGAEIGSLTIYDGEENRAVATRGLAPGFADRLREGFQPGPAHPIRELLSGARIVQVSDVGDTVDPIARASFDAGIRTSLYVPLRKDDRLLGLIVASRQKVQLFSDKEITLLENFAAQAVIAMEDARLIAETREALEQQTATAEVLQVINSSPATSPRYSTRCSKRRCTSARPLLDSSQYLTAS